jgi:hypothetical protein
LEWRSEEKNVIWSHWDYEFCILAQSVLWIKATIVTSANALTVMDITSYHQIRKDFLECIW